MNANNIADWLGAGFNWTWTTSLSACVLILVVLALLLALGKRLRPGWRYALGFLVLVRLLLPWSPPSSISVFNLGKRWAAEDPESANPAISEKSQSPRTFAETIEVPTLGKDGFHSVPDFFLPTNELQGRSGIRPYQVEEAESDQPAFAHWSAGLSFSKVAIAIWLIGFSAILGLALWQQRRFSKMTKNLEEISDPQLLRLLESAKETMGVKRHIRLLNIDILTTPAVFGIRNPRLLIPNSVLEQLNEKELRLVMLHELAHIKRRDVLLNWLIIIVRALHWFNPLVWIALKQLRSDRELICDEMVLKRLQSAEHRCYGNTLIKLLENFAQVRLSPSLLPAISGKREAKRRIEMVAGFKKTPKWLHALLACLIGVLCCFTFTQAAEEISLQSAEPSKKTSTSDSDVTGVTPHSVQIRHISYLRGTRPIELMGLGLVSGLRGTGDENTDEARKLISENLKRFNIQIASTNLIAKDIAIVLVETSLHSGAKSGELLDVYVRAMGEAKSLEGGILSQTILYGMDAKPYVIAQGPIEIPEAGSAGPNLRGNSIAANYAVTGRILKGAIVEKRHPADIVQQGNSIELVPHEKYLHLAGAITEAINQAYPNSAEKSDGSVVRVRIPDEFRYSPVAFRAQLETIKVPANTPDLPRDHLSAIPPETARPQEAFTNQEPLYKEPRHRDTTLESSSATKPAQSGQSETENKLHELHRFSGNTNTAFGDVARLLQQIKNSTPQILSQSEGLPPEFGITVDIRRLATLELAGLAEKNGNLELALQYLSEYLERFPKDEIIPEVHLRRGSIYQKQNAFDLAVAEFERAIATTPTHLANYSQPAYSSNLVAKARSNIAELREPNATVSNSALGSSSNGSPSTTQAVDPSRLLVLEVSNRQPPYRLKGRDLTLEDLKQELATRKESLGQFSLHVRTDRDVPTSVLTSALEVAGKAGITNVAMANDSRAGTDLKAESDTNKAASTSRTFISQPTPEEIPESGQSGASTESLVMHVRVSAEAPFLTFEGRPVPAVELRKILVNRASKHLPTELVVDAGETLPSSRLVSAVEHADSEPLPASPRDQELVTLVRAALDAGPLVRLRTIGISSETTPNPPEPAKSSENEIHVDPSTRRNIDIPVPLTRNIVGFIPSDPANPHSYDRVVFVDVTGKALDLARADKIVVNIKGTNGTRFAVARISMISGQEDFLTPVNERRERLFDAATEILASKTEEDIRTPGFRNRLLAELLERFNQVLGSESVKEVIITEFVIQ